MPKALSDQDVAEFRDRLCDAAEHLFAEQGPEAVTMRQLAQALGVSAMTPYRYFKDKDAILAAVRARGFNRHADVLERAYDEAKTSGGDVSEAVGRAYVRFAFDNPEAYKLMFDITQPNEADYPELVAAGERSRATMTQHLDELIGEGRLTGDKDLIGHLYWAAIHGPIMLQFSGKLAPPFRAERLIGELVAILNAHFFPPAAANEA
ncbi:TetR/AcrR family transcriptional regulator [Caulobacter sp. KR2-114]|uniref:TetR/AcrR family transcriptional regulator n=1 Tax=Caulobacter sp. KR2-114 TaxID=3400912 RepID=UPI003C021C0F